MAKSKKGCGSKLQAWCKCNAKMPHMLLALVAALGVLVLTPNVGENYSTSVMSGFMVAEEDGTADDGGTVDNGTVDDGTADNDGSADDGVINDGTADEPKDGVSDDTKDPDWYCEPGTSCTDQDDKPDDNYTDDGDWDDGDKNDGGWTDNNDNYDDGDKNDGGWTDNSNNDNTNNPDDNWTDNGDKDDGWNDWEEGTPSDQDCQADVRDARRIVRELEQMVKKAGKAGTDTSGLESLKSEAEEIKGALSSCSSLTWDELNQYRERLHGETSIQSELNVQRCWEDYKRELKDQERMEKDFERTEAHLNETKEIAGDEMQDEIENQLERMERIRELKGEVIALMDSTNCQIWGGGEDSWDAQMEMEDTRDEMDDLYYEMDEFWWKFEEVNDVLWAGQMFNDIEEKTAWARENERPNMPTAMQEKFDKMEEVATQLIAKGRECMEAGKNGCVKEVQKRLDELGRKSGFGAPDVNFEELGFDEAVGKNFKDVSGKMNYGEASDVIEYLLGLDPSLVEKITDPAIANKMFKILGHVPGHMKDDYLNTVGNLKQAYDDALESNSGLATYKDLILGKPYFGDAVDTLIGYLEDVRDGSMTVSELVAELETLATTSKQVEVSMGVSKFNDATTDTWFYEAAHKEEFNIKGKTMNGEQVFDAGGQTTFAEMLKVLVESMGLEQSGGSAGLGAGHWSEKYYRAIDGRGVTQLNPDHMITRGEMSRLMVELLGLQPESVETPFTDLTGNAYENDIETLYANGVISGDPEGTVRPNDTINRAEAFTLAGNAMDELQYVMVDTSEFEVMVEDLDELENYEYEVEGTKDGSNGENKTPDNTSDELFDMMNELMDSVLGIDLW